MKDHYDILVIGGGPGGAIAARTAAELGLSVCLAEKRAAIGTPVRCAEGIGTEAIAEFVVPDPRWISAELHGAKIVAPDGSSLTLSSEQSGNKVGYVLDRKVFDRELVWQAAAAGSDVVVKTRATAPILDEGRVRGAVLDFCGTTKRVSADVVIAADGVESKFARWCGIDTTVPLREIMSSAQYLLTDLPLDPHVTTFYVGTSIAPEGYLWVFPKGERSANVGIGISGRKSGTGHRAKDYLDSFIASRFPKAKQIEFIAGGVSVCRPLPCTVADGLMIVGDAARVVDPITGGGIFNAMFTGRMAVQVAAQAIASGTPSREALMPYDLTWRDSPMGKSIERNYRIKEVFITLSDEKLNAIIQTVGKLDLKEFSTFNLVKELIFRNPRLLLDLAPLRDIFK
ncbi:MAG: NAD(P)/FAD-dependent oxidoreductase [Methanomicrobiales archaeon]|nr:NAD(P)/FAD-dependent oxidoreductase [Methanomicrobiales archaeon]